VPTIDRTVEAREESQFFVAQAALGFERWAMLGALAARHKASADVGDVEPQTLKRLEAMANNASDRSYYKGKLVKVRGQYLPQSEFAFSVVRFRVQCCAGDAIPVRIAVISKESIAALNLKPQAWFEVTARVEFREAQAGLKTVLIVASHKNLRPCNPDLNPYEVD
jgi:uncharacterized membrane protein YcgQ (UPF0703/DUF1980 family)